MDGRHNERKPLAYIDYYYVLMTILVAITFTIPFKAFTKSLGNESSCPRSDLGTWSKLYKDHGTSK